MTLDQHIGFESLGGRSNKLLVINCLHFWYSANLIGSNRDLSPREVQNGPYGCGEIPFLKRWHPGIRKIRCLGKDTAHTVDEG